MKQTRFFRIFSLVSCFLLVATTAFTQSGRPGGNRGDNFPDFSCMVSPTRSTQLDFVKQMAAIPEFAESINVLAARFDEASINVTDQPEASARLTEYFLGKIREAKGKTEISSKDVFELLCSHVELIQIETFVKKAYEAIKAAGNEDGQADSGLAFYDHARLTVVTKFSPAEFSGMRDLFPPEIKFDIIKGGENDFLVILGSDDYPSKYFIGGQKLEGRDAYVTVLGINRDLVEQKLRMVQDERFRTYLLGDNAPASSLWLGKGVFDVMKEASLKATLDSDVNYNNYMLEQINGFSAVTRDIDGKTNVQIRLALADDETVDGLVDIAKGGMALLRFMSAADSNENTKMLLNFMRSIGIVRDGTTLTATINLSSDEFLRMAKGALVKGTEEGVVGIVIDENGVRFRTSSDSTKAVPAPTLNPHPPLQTPYYQPIP